MVARPTHNVNHPPREPQDHLRKGPTASERSLAASIYSHISWANTEDRTARTAKARATFQQKFLDEAGGDPVRAESLRKAFYRKLALQSAQTRRRNREAREGGAAA